MNLEEFNKIRANHEDSPKIMLNSRNNICTMSNNSNNSNICDRIYLAARAATPNISAR